MLLPSTHKYASSLYDVKKELEHDKGMGRGVELQLPAGTSDVQIGNIQRCASVLLKH
jgi:hypothetical protein